LEFFLNGYLYFGISFEIKELKMSKEMKRVCLIIVQICVCYVGLKAQVPQNISDSLQSVLELYQGSNFIPGISAAVNVNEVGIWTGTTGESFANTPLSPDMLMGIGSNTKTFTAALMMKLTEQGIVSLDDSLYQWLPNFTNIDSTVTIKQLLRHNSGIADFWTTAYVNEIFANPDSVWSPEDVLNFVGSPLFPPGTNVSYSNTNFVLAGMIVEAATGQEYYTLVRDSILNLLNLNHTFLEGFETITGVSAHPWHLGEDVYLVPRTAVTTAAFAAGCIKSTPEDMVNWYDQLFNRSFLSDSSFAEMTDFINISGSSVNGVGCGLFRMNYDSKTYYLHSGNIRGYASYTLYDTEDKHSISVLRNDTFVNCENVAKALARALNVLITSVDERKISRIPHQFQLFQNFPNPFNSTTTVNYNLHKAVKVTLKIYNLQGQVVKTLINENQTAGIKSVMWDGTNNNNKSVSSGIYIYSLQIGDYYSTKQSKKMLLIK
jgi:D-alanyl-D-alanine carboxypeptidase